MIWVSLLFLSAHIRPCLKELHPTYIVALAHLDDKIFLFYRNSFLTSLPSSEAAAAASKVVLFVLSICRVQSFCVPGHCKWFFLLHHSALLFPSSTVSSPNLPLIIRLFKRKILSQLFFFATIYEETRFPLCTFVCLHIVHVIMEKKEEKEWVNTVKCVLLEDAKVVQVTV